tara:strand:+ start:562 stop:807 length:246 start_codon:yes stop_codon:yes gene_type:complete
VAVCDQVAAFIKKRMDKRQQSITGGKWHCIVGPDFGSYVTYERGHFCYFYLRRKLSPIEALEKASTNMCLCGSTYVVRSES